jgi:hypothetical protein
MYCVMSHKNGWLTPRCFVYQKEILNACTSKQHRHWHKVLHQLQKPQQVGTGSTALTPGIACGSAALLPSCIVCPRHLQALAAVAVGYPAVGTPKINSGACRHS